MPVGDLPCWRQTFVDDFSTDIALGTFPQAAENTWRVYPSPWTDTTGFGTYSPEKVVSVEGGVLNKHIRTESGTPLVAAIIPKLPGSKAFGYTYGRYAVRFRADRIDGYKVAWLLWPDSDDKYPDGEIDFPERDLDSDTISGFVHRQGATEHNDQAQFHAPFDGTDWHTTVIEWSPGLVVFYLDGREIGRTTERVPNTPMHWVLQTETELDRDNKPPPSSSGNVEIDWVAAWQHDPDANRPQTSGSLVELVTPAPNAEVSSTVTMRADVDVPCGATAVKWYVNDEEVAHSRSGPPWTATWDTSDVEDGEHEVFVKSRDGAGGWATSAAVAISVANNR